MTIQFEVPMTCRQIADRASSMMLEGGALAKLASALAEFEETTGRRLFVSEGVTSVSDAVYATSGAEAHWLADSEAGVYDTDMPVEVTGVEIENAAQVEGDGSGEALPPIEDSSAASAATQVAPAPGRVSYATGKAKEPRGTKVDDRPWGKLTLPERQIVKHLERLPDTFAPQDDLQLAEMLTGGDKIDTAAAFLEVEPAVALARWKSFLSEDVIGHDGKPTIDGQARLLNALRYRVETGA